MRGLSVFTAIAIISDIITVKRFSNSKKFASYLRSTPRVSSSNEKTIIKSTNKAGIVRMGMCRRVITEIYQMLKKEEYHYFMDPENHKKKMNEYIKLLKKKGVNFSEEFVISYSIT